MRNHTHLFDVELAPRDTREVYIRATLDLESNVKCEVGLELRGDDIYEILLGNLERLISHHKEPLAAAEEIEREIKAVWPDRAYFIEIWNEGQNGWIQIFVPFGLPRR